MMHSSAVRFNSSEWTHHLPLNNVSATTIYYTTLIHTLFTACRDAQMFFNFESSFVIV